jgi:hypothetical protein
MRALAVCLLAACGSSSPATPDLASGGDMVVALPPEDMAGGCTTCTAFSTTCGAALNCSKLMGHTGTLCCKTPGATPAGMPCATDEDCAADTVCLPDKLGQVQSRCYLLCDGSHVCPGGSCNVFSGLQVCR